MKKYIVISSLVGMISGAVLMFYSLKYFNTNYEDIGLTGTILESGILEIVLTLLLMLTVFLINKKKSREMQYIKTILSGFICFISTKLALPIIVIITWLLIFSGFIDFSLPY